MEYDPYYHGPDSSNAERQSWHPRRDGRTIGQLFSKLAREMQTLLRQEFELVQTEASEMATQAQRSARVMVTGGLVAYAGFLALVVAASILLGTAMPLWLSFAVVGIVVAVTGSAILFKGRADLRDTNFSFDHTVRTLQEDTQWITEEVEKAKGNPRRRHAER